MPKYYLFLFYTKDDAYFSICTEATPTVCPSDKSIIGPLVYRQGPTQEPEQTIIDNFNVGLYDDIYVSNDKYLNFLKLVEYGTTIGKLRKSGVQLE